MSSALRLAALLLFAALPEVRAQAPADTAAFVIGAGALTDGRTIRVDGRLDEAAWATAPVATDFVQLEPQPGEPSSERTEARVVAGPRALYVGITAHVRDPSTLIRRMTRRDEIPASDRVVVEIGSPADRRTAYSFGVTLAGVQHDVLLYDDVYEDASWDVVWESAVARLPEGGYSVEFRIPYGQLRYEARSDEPWDIQFQRDIAATGERVYWAPVQPDREGYVSQFGYLASLPRLAPPRRVEVVPYAGTRVTRADGDADDPFYRATDVTPSVGLDARIGLTSGLTMTATVNPDFGQVEADPAVVDLSQFEVFFEERRPFFVEGTDIFAFGAARGPSAAERPSLFYSRRIGGAPLFFDTLYPDTSYAWVTAPDQTTIATAAKVSGQIGGWTVGLLDAVTTRETARLITESGTEFRLPVASTANYLVARARRSGLDGRRVAGAFASSVVRDVRRDAFAARLPGTATLAGVDGELATAGRRWTFSGVAVGSLVTGEAGVIETLQRAPQRYFQRPDADHLGVDTSATSLGGYRVEGAVARTAGSNWRGGLTLAATSPGFESNDLGFQQRADLVSADALVEYRIPRPRSPLLRFVLLQLGTSQGLSFGGDHVVSSVTGQVRTRFSGLWETQLIGVVRPLIGNDRLTRGGPVSRRPADANLTWYTATNRARRVAVAFTAAARGELPHDHAEVGREWTVRLRPTLYVQPSDALALSFEPVWTRAFNTDQYLGRRAAPGRALDGQRYLFSDTDIAQVAVALRADWAFAPGLTLQIVGTPQVDAVRFSGFRELAAAGTFDFVRYGTTRGSVTPVTVGDDGTETPTAPGQRPDRYRVDPGDGDAPFALANRDFTRLSLRGNAVLRWEWRPGSALFVVWQQTRDETLDFDGLGVFSGLPDALGAAVENVFLVKATYWFGL